MLSFKRCIFDIINMNSILNSNFQQLEMCAHVHKSRHPTLNIVFLKAGLVPPGITLLRDQWQANSFTKDKAYERSVWKRRWGTRNTELGGKYLNNLDYWSHAMLLWLWPSTAAAWAAQFIPEHCSNSAPPLSPSHWHYHRQSVRAMSCANPIPAWAHRRKSLPASRSPSVQVGAQNHYKLVTPSPIRMTCWGDTILSFLWWHNFFPPSIIETAQEKTPNSLRQL